MIVDFRKRCRSAQILTISKNWIILQDVYLIANIFFGTAENEPSKIFINSSIISFSWCKIQADYISRFRVLRCLNGISYVQRNGMSCCQSECSKDNSTEKLLLRGGERGRSLTEQNEHCEKLPSELLVEGRTRAKAFLVFSSSLSVGACLSYHGMRTVFSVQ